jgi:hypothetical protein
MPTWRETAGQLEFIGVRQDRDEQRAEIERLRNLVSDLIDLIEEMPVKHPQQSTMRKMLRGQAELFNAYRQKT